MNNIKSYGKLLVIMLAAYVIADFGVNNVFLAKTPKINPFAMQNMKYKVNNFIGNTSAFVASLNPLKQINNSSSGSEINNSGASIANIPQPQKVQDEITNALSAPMTKLSQGVYASEVNDIKVYEVRTDELGNEYKVYKFNINGKEIQIKVPVNQTPPTKEELEGIF